MTKIDDHIYIGNDEDYKQAKSKGIQAILNVARDTHYPQPDGVEYQHIPLTDDEKNDFKMINDAADALANFVQQGKKTLVHCRAGVSRSPSVAALYYYLHAGWPSVHSALDAIKDKRPIVQPTEGMWQSTLLCAMQGANR